MTLDDFYAEQEYLEHHGIKGQKWGVRRTPEQLGHYIEKKRKKLAKTVQAANRARSKGDMKTYNKLMNQRSKITTNIQKAQKLMGDRTAKRDEYNRKQEEKAAAKRQEFLRTASSEEIYEKRSEFSEQELQQVIRRINTEQTLSYLKDQDKADKLANGKKIVDNTVNLIESGVKAFGTYENVAKTLNKIMGEDALPVFSESYDKRKKEAEKKKRKPIDDLIKSGDYTEIMKSKDKLTPDELKTALSIAGETTSKAIGAQIAKDKKRSDDLSTIKSTESKRIREEYEKSRDDEISVNKSAKTSYDAAKKNYDYQNGEYEKAQREADKLSKELRSEEKTLDSWLHTLDKLERDGKITDKALRDYNDAVDAYNAKQSQRDAALVEASRWKSVASDTSSRMASYKSVADVSDRRLSDLKSSYESNPMNEANIDKLISSYADEILKRYS